MEIDKAIFYLDNKAVIHCLNGRRSTSRVISECFRALNQLGELTEVEIRHVYGHKGNTGNEESDELAKAGTMMRDYIEVIRFTGERLDGHQGGQDMEENSEGENRGQQNGAMEGAGVDSQEQAQEETRVKEILQRLLTKTKVIVPLPSAMVRNKTEEAMMKDWTKRWTELQTCQHTKVFWTGRTRRDRERC